MAELRILALESDITLEPDGMFLITETIQISSDGDSVKHGIIHPIVFQNSGCRHGKLMDFEVLSVTRDGAREPYRVKSAGKGYQTYIGDKNVTLTPGEYTYQITYRIRAEICKFRDFDMVHWDAVGAGWPQPIGFAKATMRLPEGAEAIEWKPDVFSSNLKPEDIIVKQVDARTAEFTLPDDLGNGPLYIRADMTKGLLSEPNECEPGFC